MSDWLEAIKARRDRVPAAPWLWAKGEHGETALISETATILTPAGRYCDEQWLDVYPDEAEFLAHSRADIDTLVAEVEKLRRALAACDDLDEALT